jgi:hypothetical protein
MKTFHVPRFEGRFTFLVSRFSLAPPVSRLPSPARKAIFRSCLKAVSRFTFHVSRYVCATWALGLVLSVILAMAGTVYGQQIDMAFGVGTVTSPSLSSTDTTHSPQNVGGGTFLAVSGDALIAHQLGFNGEVSWRASQNSYLAAQPFRPIFFDFNGIWAPHLAPRVGAEVMGGIGAEDVRFYQPFFTCSSFGGCTNFSSSTHFMGHFGGGIKLYVLKHVFLRPEAHLYLIHDNVEFSSDRASRFGVSLGYTLSPEY